MADLLTPIALLQLAILVGLVRLWRKKDGRRPLRGVAVPAVLLTVLSTPPAAYLALGSLEWGYPPADDVPADAGAIVVLAGSVRPPDRVRTRTELGPNTLDRCLHAAAVHRSAPDRPVLVSGGPADRDGAPAGAGAMRDFLVGQGVPADRILVDDRSRTTYENAVECGHVLRGRGIGRVVLVTDAFHMRRAAACFRAQGVDVVPSACGHVATEFHWAWTDAVPSARSTAQVDQAWHEWLGLAAYWVQGRI